jgi:uncharacterized protein YcbK (DUF882 family)
MSTDRRTPRPATRSTTTRPHIGAIAVILAAAVAVLQFTPVAANVGRAPFAMLSNAVSGPAARASRDAFGVSQAVKLMQALPGDSLEYPLELGGGPGALTYRWVRVSSGVVDTTLVPTKLTGAVVLAPRIPGFYRLAVSRAGVEEIIAEPTLAVAVPFSTKVGSFLNGYRIGRYLAERIPGHPEPHPDGFIEVTADMVDLPVSRHLRLGDFLTHDAQDDVWPKYLALDPRLLDKVELVLARLALLRGLDSASWMALDVHSGFRTPAYNQRVDRAARDSRHQYGDAADLVIDADGNGRINVKDDILIAAAVDHIEAAHPDLVGGLGLYTSRRFPRPYVHIDTRGTRKRWKG